MRDQAVIIGNSDGIGLALSRALLGRGWAVHGLSRSASPIEHANYRHAIVDVRKPEFSEVLARTFAAADIRLVVFCAGIGEVFDPQCLTNDIATFETNLMGLIRTVDQTLPHFVSRKAGTLVGLSSMADILRWGGVPPAYGASKAGMSHYLESMARALAHTNIRIVNVRLGFVDTKMAKADVKLWLLQPADVSERILRAVLSAAPPRRLNIPRRMALLTRLGQFFGQFL